MQTELNPKRHCMVVLAFYPLAETRVQRQAEALVEQGYEVDVICMGNNPRFEVVRKVNVYRLPVRQYTGTKMIGTLVEYLHFFVLAMLALNRLYRQKRYGTIQVHNLPDFLVFCALWPKLCGARIILDIHDVMPEFFAVVSNRPMAHWLVQLVVLQERLSCKFADHVITVTEVWRQTLIKRGVAAEKTSVVMNIPDARLFHREVLPLTEKASNSSFCLIYHGSQTKRAGLDILLNAIARLHSDIPNLSLILHGNGDYREELIKLTRELNIEDYVEFSTRFLSISELPQLITTADVGVVPYQSDIFTDGILPTKLMEYIALGLPVIISRTPVVEAYVDDTMVEFFEPGQVDSLVASIRRLYDEPERRKALIENSIEFVQKYNWTDLSADYVALVDRLTS